LAAEQYEWLSGFLAGQGYEQYEISNWSRPGRECRHNLQYWRNRPYLGLGAGAHGYADGIRYSNVLRIKTYIDRLNTETWSLKIAFPLSPATVNHHINSRHEDMDETMMTGLRLTSEGVSAETFYQRFGAGLTEIYGKQIDSLVKLGLLEWFADRIRLTSRGRLLGNQVFMHFVGE
jgi:oxygen-independent coproporphyrinogen-3 oxidase